MDTTTLVDKQYEEGKKLIEFLDAKGLRFPIALWLFDEEKNDWVLSFGVTNLRRIGSKDIFKQIQETIVQNSIEISISNITLKDTTSDIYKLLRSSIGRVPGLGRVSFFGNIINGQRFPDSVIYRVR
jgi:hypothetical protein